MTTINDIAPLRKKGCDIVIDFTPKGQAYSYVAGVTTYTPANTYWAGQGHLLTFTYTADFADDDAYVIQARWDMGDKTINWGSPIRHTYKAAVPHTQVSVQLRDNFGNVYSARKHVPLREEFVGVLTKSIVAQKT